MENKPKVLTDKYEVGKLLGKGSFAKVYFGKRVITKESVAIKVIDKKLLFEEEEKNRLRLSDLVKREISIMRMIDHPNVVKIYEVIATKTKIYLVIEYCKGGDLGAKVQIAKDLKVRLKEEIVWKYFCQLINALEFCHSRGVYHRDIRLENMLLDENDNLKVSDFGLGALADCKHQDGLLHTRVGTWDYISPEILNYKAYDGEKADIWSCGVALFYLLANVSPFNHHNPYEMARRIKIAQFKYPTVFPSEAKSLLSKMLEPNPTNRITISKIKETIWFKKHLLMKVRETSFLDLGGLTENHEPFQLAKLDAFDLIAMCPGSNLTGLFGDGLKKQESRFLSQKLAPEIISKLKEVSLQLDLKIRKQGEGVFKLEGWKEGQKEIVTIKVEIFEVTETFHLVEVKKCNGDTLEYEKLLKENVRPALADIVLVWLEKEKEEQLPLSLIEMVANAWRRVFN